MLLILTFVAPVMGMQGPRLFLVVVAACLIKEASGFPNGKVSVACGDMKPQHGHASSSKSAPYNITVDQTTFSPGDQITVTLQVVPTTEGAAFKGFLIEARDVENLDGPAVGSFSLLNPSESQLLQCGDTQGSAVSHTSKSKKTDIQAMWKAPENPPLGVQFMATVVQKYKVYWVKLPGPVVSLNGATVVPPPKSTTTATTALTTPSVWNKPFSSEGCGRRKSCLRDPEGCDPERDPLCFFLSFTPEEHTVLFELSGPSSGYMSFALSQDKWMGDDDAYLCVRDGDRVDINAAYLPGRTEPEFATQNVLSDMSWRLADGVIQCRFRREIHLPVHNRSRFSLDQSFFLFVAHGRSADGVVHRHDRQPLISTYQTVITGPPKDLAGSRSPLLMKFHGVFMLVAWMTTVTTGVIIARYFKMDWPGTTLLGQSVWFQVHRALMILTVLLTSVGFMLPFIYRGGWSKRAGSHPYLGCTVMALSVIQPIMALVRPAQDSSRRNIFNWAHWGTGTTVQILAVAAIFLGIQQQALLLPVPWSTGILAGCVVWGILIDLLLEFHNRGVIQTTVTVSEDKESILSTHLDKERQRKVSLFRKIVLAVFLVGNFGFLSGLINTIASM
ncbi:putative ferric-chelate reductase 1 isoform X2 [Esox lucius]|uniref:Ferric-chelate reductase 1b n=1 Tax=Esox lucius TaxID=8010 RepID=A0AAY5JYJ2_ESOLU|nr:putative ferric-chelate reductase 1 isoform X2 [Esox lucius]